MGNTPKMKQKAKDPSGSRPVSAARGRPPWVRWVVGGVVVGTLVLFVAFVSQDVASNPQGVADPPAGTETIAIPDVSHTEGTVIYDRQPPAGGSHHPVPLACGVYDQAVRNENAVHALEHGAVWIAYRPGLTDGEVADLEAFGRRSEIIVSPYPELDSPVVLTSWGRQLHLDRVDTTVIDQFIRAFKNRTAPENAAVC